MAATAFSLIGRISMQGMSSALKEVEGLEDAVKKVSKELGKLGQNLTKAGTFMSKNLTAPIAAATAAVGLLSLKTGEYASKLNSLEQATGLTKDTIQELTHVAKTAGASSDDLFSTITHLTNSLPQLAQGTGKGAEALDRLKITVKNADGSMKDMNDLFPEILQGLQGVENITERNQLAFDIFGKKLPKDVLAMTSDEMGRLRKEAHDMGLVMGEKALKQADDFRIGVENLKAQIAAVGRDVSMAFIPVLNETLIPLIQTTLIPTLHTAAMVLTDLGKVFQTFPTPVQVGVIAIGGFVAALGPVLLVVGKLTLAIKAAIPVIASLGVTAGVAAKSVAAFALGIGGVITVAIAGAVALAALVVKTEELNRETAAYNKQTEDYSRRTTELNRQVKAAANLVAEYEKLAGTAGFDAGKLERLKTAHEDTVIALKNHAREMNGKGKLDEIEIENTRRKMRGLQELTAADKTQTEYAIAQAKERAKAYAEEASRRKKELNDAVRDYESKLDDMFLSDIELVEKERDLEVKRLIEKGASEEQLLAVYNYYNEKRFRLIEEADEKKKKEADQADKDEKARREKKYDEEVKWQEKLISKRLEADSRELSLLGLQHQEKLKATENSMASQVSIHEQYAQEQINIRKQMAYKQLDIMNMEYQDALNKAKEAGADLTQIHEYYQLERTKIVNETAIEQYRIEKDLTHKIEDETKRRIGVVTKWMDAVSSVLSKLGTLFSQYSKNEEKREDNRYKREKERIEADFENHVITEEQKKKKLEELEEAHDEKTRNLQRQSFERQKKLNLASIVIDTAGAIMKALRDMGPILGTVYATAIGALGVAQFGLVASEPAPFYDGGLIKGSQEGIHAQIGERNQDEVVFPLQTGIDKIVEGLNASNSGSQTTNYTVNVNVGSFIGDRKSIQDLGKKIREVIISEDRRTGVSYATA